MNNSENPKSMFDSRFVITLVLILFCWLGWQSYLAKKYPDAYKKTNTTATAKPEVDQQQASVNPSGQPAPNSNSAVAPEVKQETTVNTESFLTFDDANLKFQLSSHGMSLKNVVLKKHTRRNGEAVTFVSDDESHLFATGVMGQREPLNFNLKQTAEAEFVGVAELNGMKVTKVIHIDPQTYTLKSHMKAENIPASVVGFYTEFSEKINEHAQSNFFSRDPEHQEFFISHEGKSTRTLVQADQQMTESFVQTKVAGFGSQYFAFAVIDKSPVIPEFKATVFSNKISHGLGVLSYSLLNKADNFVIEYTGFIGPKSYNLLKAVDTDLASMIDFGFFTSIAKGIFWLMRAIFNTVGNWGVAIIFLTILVRIFVLPFNLMGYKQMKAMTKIQPQMKALREKYKNDPQRMNQETLALMKDAKANPLGGCLPMLLQIPIFFALYQVIGNSIELYQAPFFLWIHDLSAKDPFYVLPVLMGITMFIQQKITPSAMDPMQQKIMMFLPIMFTFFMVGLPSGLTLYIFISSVFGVIQQLYFMKEKGAATA